MITLTDSEKEALLDLSQKLGTSPDWLYGLIAGESAWNPQAKNPNSSARGLIQFMDATAISMGYDSSLDLVQKHPTREEQLRGPVYDYLKAGAPYPTAQSLTMQVFFPIAKFVPPDTTFEALFKQHYGAAGDAKYKAFAKANPGIVKVSDYVDRFEAQVRRYAPAAGLGAALIAAGIYWFFVRNIT